MDLVVGQRHADHVRLWVPGEGGDEDIFGEILDGFDVGDFRVALPRRELVEGECAGGGGDAEV